MGYTAGSFSAGQQPTTAQWNVLWANDASFNDGTGIANLEIGSGHTSLKNDYKFSVYRNAALNTTNAAGGALVPHDTKVFDTGSNVDVVTNKGRFTAPIAGFYYFSAMANGGSAAATPINSYLYKNGALAKVGNGSGSAPANTYSSVSALIQLLANDYVEHWFIGGSGNAMTVGISAQTYFDGFLVSQT